MSDTIETYTSPGMKNATLIYVLYLLGFIVPVIAIVGLVFAYMSRGKADNATESHYTFQIRTFWIALIASVIAGILIFVGIGLLLIFAVYIWALVRCVKGIINSSRHDPITDPNTYLF
ncbi:MAG: DUF4870 domain-containing protein [Pseudomonadota bacterium]